MRYAIFIAALIFSMPSYAQHKTVARPSISASKMTAEMAIVQKHTGDIPLDVREKREREKEELFREREEANKKRKAELMEIDGLVPDAVEKVIDVLTAEQKAALDPAIKSMYDRKKELRRQQ